MWTTIFLVRCGSLIDENPDSKSSQEILCCFTWAVGVDVCIRRLNDLLIQMTESSGIGMSKDDLT
ncbi:MAG: hypothetical protein DWI14_00140, partial [Planctomycetota bacterium]